MSYSAAASSAPAAAADSGPPSVPSLANFQEGFTYGMSHLDITRIYNQVGGIFDKEYNPLLLKMQPGVRMEAMEAERDKKKASFAAGLIQFKDTPLGFDTTGLSGEYSYKNHESVQLLRRDYGRRFFFYFGDPPNDRYWKLYDEIKLCDGCIWGKSYQEAVQKMNGKLGVAGRARPADPSKGYSRPYTEWQDASSHLRIVDRSGEGEIGLTIGSKSIESQLPQLRANKLDDPFAMDPSVAAATRGNLSDPNGMHAAPDAGPPPKPKHGKH
ncbi:MAG: hypothetical protein ACREJX_04410 [Polyangiaceae bacterium]